MDENFDAGRVVALLIFGAWIGVTAYRFVEQADRDRRRLFRLDCRVDDLENVVTPREDGAEA